MKKEKKFKKNRSGFIEVPTYQFPQNEEYADEIISLEEKRCQINKKNNKK